MDKEGINLILAGIAGIAIGLGAAGLWCSAYCCKKCGQGCCCDGKSCKDCGCNKDRLLPPRV